MNSFSTIDSAISAASSGDIIYIEPSPTTYPGFTVDKTLHFIGNGNFLDQITNGPFNKSESHTGAVTFNEGSDSSTVVGLRIDQIYLTNVKGISIRMNRTGGISLYNSTFGILISENVTGSIRAYNTNGSGERTTIKNNVIISYGHCIYGLRNSDIRNNTLHDTYSTNEIFSLNEGCVIINNILDRRGQTTIEDITANNNSTVATNNLTVLSTEANLKDIPDDGSKSVITNKPESVFSVANPWDANPFKDADFKLKPDSPALKIATDGKEAGAFGGITPYKPSGIPNIPIITSAWGTGAGTSALPLTIKISVQSN
ncbi:hypothetical protein GCM10011325_36910 [Dyadobacter sediminis]|nr:hypothetical protein GCM10011325_36910 [Dyadobacter sediminis]